MKNNPQLLWHKRTNSDFYFRCFPFWSFISVTWQQMNCTSLHVDSLIFSPAENGCGAWKCQRDFPEGGRGCCPCKSEFDLLPDEPKQKQLDYFSCCQACASAEILDTSLYSCCQTCLWFLQHFMEFSPLSHQNQRHMWAHHRAVHKL